jgi:hypothetical protein
MRQPGEGRGAAQRPGTNRQGLLPLHLRQECQRLRREDEGSKSELLRAMKTPVVNPPLLLSQALDLRIPTLKARAYREDHCNVWRYHAGRGTARSHHIPIHDDQGQLVCRGPVAADVGWLWRKESTSAARISQVLVLFTSTVLGSTPAMALSFPKGISKWISGNAAEECRCADGEHHECGAG